MPQARRRVAALLLAPFLALLPAACTPLTLSIGLGPQPAPITEQLIFDEPGRDKVALIDVRGILADAREPGILGPGANPVDILVSQLQRAERDASIRAVILRINSPGGTVTASDVLYHEIRGFAQRSGKPVIASLGEVAASGGYYIALAGDEIVAQPTCITASIGVLIPLMNFSEGLNRIGIYSTAITSGPNKAMGNPFDAPDNTHEALYQDLVDEFYHRFRSLVLARRPGIPPDSVEDATDGRIMTGDAALRAGLVDSLGGIREAFAAAKARANLGAADLVKLSGSAGETQSAYARSPSVEVNLLKLQPELASGPNFFYLWTARPTSHTPSP